MTELERLWLELPGVDPTALDRAGVSFRASQMVGGVRQMGADWVLPVYVDPPSCWHVVDDPALIDLVAFDPAQPSRWRTKHGSAAMLGEEAHREARLYRLVLPVFRDPLGWLRAGGGGVFPLDAQAFAIAMIGFPPVEIVGEDVEHGRELRRLVQSIPRMSVPRVSVAA